MAGAPNTFLRAPPHSGQVVSGSSLIGWTMSSSIQWVELDGWVIRGRRLFTRKIFELQVADITDAHALNTNALGPMENATYRDYVGDIHSSGQHLLNLINEILDLSRIEAGRMELDLETMEVEELLANSVLMLKPRASAHGIEMKVQSLESAAFFPKYPKSQSFGYEWLWSSPVDVLVIYAVSRYGSREAAANR